MPTASQGRDGLDGRERRPQRAASKRAGAHRTASQRATAARHSQITHLRTLYCTSFLIAGTRRMWRGAATRGRAGARIVGFELGNISYASTCLSSYPACSSEPRRVARPLLIRIDPAPAPYLTVLTFLSLTETQLLFHGLCLRIQRPAAVAEGGRERLVQRGRAEHEPVVAWQLVQLGRHAERLEPSRHLA